MTEENPKPETGETEPKPEQPKDIEIPVWEDGKPFDPERAKTTILNLRGQEKTWKTEHAELEQFRAKEKQRAEAEMTETQRLQKQKDDTEAENARLKLDLLRRDVISETGLPAIFSDRLQGATKEEMLEDAKKLLEALPKQTKVAPKIPSTNPSNADVTETDAQKRERLFGKQGNAFDPEVIKSKGGGVVWNK